MPKSIENTVFVRFVPAPTHMVRRHELEDIFSQMGPIKKSSWINNARPQQSQQASAPAATTATSSGSKGYGFVKYLAQQDAEAAAKELHNSKIQMEGQDYTLKVELASLPSSSTSKATSNATPPAKKSHNDENRKTEAQPPASESSVAMSADDAALLKKKSRIIVRNLSFYAKEQHIRKVLEPTFGKVLDVHLPRVKENLHVGFAFVTFERPQDAQKAVETKRVDISKRTVTMEWSLPKKLHQQQKQQEQKEQQQKNAIIQAEKEEQEDSHDKEEEDDKDASQVDASDDDNNDDGDATDSGNDSDSDGSEDSSAGSVEDDDEEMTSDNEDNGEKVQHHDDAVEKKCTLFLRNLPFDATRHDIFQVFCRFGYIKGIYLVKDKDTGMLKGTAFVTYSKPQSAQLAVDHAATEGDGGAAGTFVSQREGSMNSNSDAASTRNNHGSLILNGRKISVDLAVDKETAATFDAKDSRIPSADRRNLYLQAESRVESSSIEPTANNANTWDDLPPQDQKKRQTALKDKTTKLQSPIFFINPKRLSFRNMAKHVDEVGLQKLCELAVKRGLEKGLVGAKDQIAHWRALGELSTREILAKVQEMDSSNEAIIPRWENGDVDAHKQTKYNIPSVYIDRDYGPSGKKKDAPSRGFGFAEFTYHAHALACLRELNNNPAYSRDYVAGGKAADVTKKRSRKIRKPVGGGDGGGSGGVDYVGEDGRVHVPRLIVDFTVENKVKAKKQADRRMLQQMNQTKQQLEKKEKELVVPADDITATNNKRGRGAIQREKKRQKRESGEDERERQAKLEAKALAEAKKEMRKERQAQKKKKAEEAKKKTVKPAKKKKRMDEEDEKFDDIVRSYASKLETARKETTSNPREAVQEKRWFE